MNYKQLGRTGMLVEELCFGTPHLSIHEQKPFRNLPAIKLTIISCLAWWGVISSRHYPFSKG